MIIAVLTASNCTATKERGGKGADRRNGNHIGEQNESPKSTSRETTTWTDSNVPLGTVLQWCDRGRFKRRVQDIGANRGVEM